MSTEDAPSLLELGLLHEEVRELQGVLAEVEDRRRAAAVAAVRAGKGKAPVALAVGVTRQTLDKWLGDWTRKR
nr:MAG TPA: HOMEOBOX PROTEIN PAX-6/DNA COMPLEX, PAIRED DOMAIN, TRANSCRIPTION, PROTEIN-DNA.5A [Caudoviricetes sp.]